MRRLFLLLVAACTFATTPLADVLDDPDPDFSLRDTIAVGPFHAAPFFYIRDLGYDDNVRLGADDRTGDLTLTVGPGARAVMPMGRRAALALWDEINYAMFASERDLNSVNNTLRAKGHLYLRDTIAFLEGEQRSFRERPNYEIDYRLRDTTTTGRVGARYLPQRRLGLEGSINVTTSRLDAGNPSVPDGVDPDVAQQQARDIVDRLERNETSARLLGRLKVRPRTTVMLDLDGSRIDFLSDRWDTRDSDARSIMIGAEFDPSGPLRGFAKVGVKRLRPESSSFEGFDGLIADAALSARIAGRGDLRAVYQRNTGFSTLGDNLFFVQDHRALGYEHYVTPRLSLNIERHLYESDYPVPLTGQIPPHRTDDIVQNTLSVRYRLGPSLRVGLAFGRWERDSTIDSDDATRNTITTLLEYTP